MKVSQGPNQGVSTEKQQEMDGPRSPDASNHQEAREVGRAPETI